MGRGEMSRELSQVEREVYELIERLGEVMTAQIPRKKAGAVPRLVSEGLVEVFKRSLSPRNAKKTKFVRLAGEKTG